MKTDSKKTNARNTRNNIWLLKKVWQYTPGYVIWMVMEGVIWGINHSISIIYTQRLFEALGDGDTFEKLLRIILGYAVYLVFFYIFHNWYWYLYNPVIRQKLHIKMHTDLFNHAVEIDLCQYDDPEFYNQFIWAMDKSYEHAVGMMEDTGKLINRCVASVTLTSVLFSVDKTVALLILVGSFLRFYLTYAYNKINLKCTETLNPLERKDDYIKRVFRLPDYAKDLRITNVQKPLMKEYGNNVDQQKAVTAEYGKKMGVLQSISWGLSMIVENGLIILVLYKVMVSGELGLGGFAVAMNASWKMSWLLGDMVSRLMKYHEHGGFIEKMLTFLECKPKIVDGTENADAFESLVIRNLHFAYDNSQQSRDELTSPGIAADGKKENCVLKNVELEIRKGEKIAIVGYNGAGKTTFTKLLMRLYDPDEGEILYNGKNLKEYNLKSLRSHIAAVFQDYRIFACSLAENVAGGSCEEKDSQRAIDALSRSTFGEKLEELQGGIHTQLTREFDHSGTQLSGGEQQKVAIARTFYKDADLMILDEPSSALDPDAEYALNQAVMKNVSDKTVIFISHRLSTTRNADRIYMFDGGQIVERGTHEELIAANGKYAYIFQLQAEKYRG